MPTPTVYRTALRGLERLHEGKVRDIYALDGATMLIVTTDRLSAFDVVLPDPIPDKGRVLNSISNFWFARTQHLVPNHLSGRELSSVIADADERALLEGRAVIVRRLRALPIEAVVRGYLIGSGWKDYRASGAVCGASPPSFDKQFVRDYLETLDWNKQPPGPRLPPELIARTSEKYREALARLTG